MAPASRDLKTSREGDMTTSEGRLFHIRMVTGKKPWTALASTTTESYRRRDSGSRATDDINHDITDPPVSQVARQV